MEEVDQNDLAGTANYVNKMIVERQGIRDGAVNAEGKTAETQKKEILRYLVQLPLKSKFNGDRDFPFKETVIEKLNITDGQIRELLELELKDTGLMEWFQEDYNKTIAILKTRLVK